MFFRIGRYTEPVGRVVSLSYDRILSEQGSTLKSKGKILVSSIVKNIELMPAGANREVYK